MQLTPREIRLIQRLRKEESRWPYLRWLMLAVGLLSLVVCTGWGWILYNLVQGGSRDRLDPMDVFLVVLLWTKCCMWFVIGAWFFSTTCAKWHGDANRMLLLRLLDEHQVETGGDKPAV